jgi:hypothetical protein
VGPQVAAILLRCLQRSPADRFASAGALMNDLCAAMHVDRATPTNETGAEDA